MGGEKNIFKLKSETDRLRYSVLFFVIIFILQGLLFKSNIISSDYFNNSAFIINSIGSLVLAFWFVYLPARDKTGKYVQHIGLQLSVISLIFATTGLASPTSLAISVIIFEGWKVLGKKGLYLSLLIFGVFIAYGIYVAYGFNKYISIELILYALTTIVLTAFLIGSNIAHKKDRNRLELLKTQAEIEAQKTNTVINLLDSAIFGLDSTGEIQYYNGAALAILNTHKSLIGNKFIELIDFKNSEGEKVSILEHFKKNNHDFRSDDLFSKIGDQVYRFEIIISKIIPDYGRSMSLTNLDGGFLIRLKDVTTRKNIEDEKDEFLSVISHELRTPLAAIEGTISNAQLIAQKMDLSKSRLDTILNSAHSQTLYLSQIVHDLSELSRIDTNSKNILEEFNLKEVLEGIYSSYQEKADQKDIQFNLDIPPKIKLANSNKLYVQELTQNLVENAIKYTKEGSVTLGAKIKNGQINIFVKDTGIGINKSDIGKIFNKFYRSEDYRTRETNGTGLGLYISSKLARKIDSYINVKSRINQGSEFSFNINEDRQ